MPHLKQTILVLTFAVALSASVPSVTLARPAPPTKEQIRLAQERLALKEQLADMQMKFTDRDPRIVALKEQIASYDHLVTPQASIKAKPRLLHKLRARRADLRLQLLDAQTKYTDSNPRVRELHEQLNQINQLIAEVKSKH